MIQFVLEARIAGRRDVILGAGGKAVFQFGKFVFLAVVAFFGECLVHLDGLLDALSAPLIQLILNLLDQLAYLIHVRVDLQRLFKIL